MKTHVCETCGNEFQGLQHIKRKYCSQTCFGLGRRGKFVRNTIKAPCQQCGTEIEYFPGNPRKFCSSECYARWQSENLSGEQSYFWQGGPKTQCFCKQCGKQMFDYARLNRRFCSMRCKGAWQTEHSTGENNPLWKGGLGPNYYGPNWGVQRRAARKRDRYKCRHCDVSEKILRTALDVHHIIPFKTFGYIVGENENYRLANALENLICLCKGCHKRAEHGGINLQLPLLID